ncbi:MAG TPA: hypothetical protein PKD34_02295, partial [Candidatus Doudnabacteria bacterium]|nr:hypothetical protein [Candidatus Doudnabacteria bacterium]
FNGHNPRRTKLAENNVVSLSSLENSLEDFLDMLTPYFNWVPPIDEDDEDSYFFPEFYQEAGLDSVGTPYTAWITFIDGLSISILSIYFEAVTKADMVSFVHNLFVSFKDIVHRIEIQDDSIGSNWIISVESPSRWNH